MSITSNVWPLNEKGEIVASPGTGSNNIAGFVSQDNIPTDANGRVPIVGTGPSALKEAMRKLRLAGQSSQLPVPATQVTTAQVTGSWTPGTTPANGMAEQTFTVSAMNVGDVPISGIPPSALDPSLTIRALRWINATTIGVTFQNTSAGVLSAPTGTWTVTVARFATGLPLDAPLVTLSAASAATALGANIKTLSASSGSVRMRCPWQYHPSLGGGGVYATNASVTTPENPPLTKYGYILGVDFMTDAPKMEIITSAFAAPMQVIVDGKIVTAAPLITGYKQDLGYRLTIDFTQGGTITNGVRKARKVRIEWGSQGHFAGLVVTKADSVWLPTNTDSIRGIVFGDSFTAGTQSQNQLLGVSRESYNGFANRLGDLLGWEETFTSGFPSTGYLRTVNTGSGTGVKFRDRINDILAPQWGVGTTTPPDIVVVVGSVNDRTFTDAQVQAEVTAFYTQLVASLPASTVIVAVGVQNPRDNYGSVGQYAALNSAVQAGVSAVNAPNLFFVDIYGIVSGTGYVGNVKNDGNADVITGADGTHPSMEGYNYYANKINAAIASIILANS